MEGKKMMNGKIGNILKIDSPKKLFFVIMWIGILAFEISIILSNGESLKNILFCQENQTFLDFFECIVYGRHPYDSTGSYPPLAYVLFWFFGKMTSYEIRSQGILAVRENQNGLVSLSFFIILAILLLFVFINTYYKGSNYEKMFFLITILFSIPFIFLIERANVVWYIIPLIGYFLFNYDSDNKKKRRISYICLSIAAGIKIYPALLGVLILKRKKLHEIIECIFWGIIFFFCPFIVIGGGLGIIGFWNNFINSLNIIGGDLGYGYKVNITNTVSWISIILNDTNEKQLGTILCSLICVAGLIIFGVSKFKSKWKLWMIPLLLMILLPGFSFIYVLTYLTIPLIAFLNENRKEKIDYLYAILFALLFVPMIVRQCCATEFKGDYYLLNFSTIVESCVILIFYIIILIEGIFSGKKNDGKL